MLISNFPEIENIRFVRFPVGGTKATKVARVGSTIFALLEGGQVACSAEYVAKFAIGHNTDPARLRDILDGLVKLGVIPKAIMTAHLDACAKVRGDQEKRRAAETIAIAAKTLQIDLTLVQQRRIAAVTGAPAANNASKAAGTKEAATSASPARPRKSGNGKAARRT